MKVSRRAAHLHPATRVGPAAARPRDLSAPLLVDCVTEAAMHSVGAVVVTGSHGGVSSVDYALAAHPRVVVFNDAGLGRDGAGIAALDLLERAGVAACTVAHTSARIGDAHSTLEDGVISQVNAFAEAMGAQPGLRCRDWVASLLPH